MAFGDSRIMQLAFLVFCVVTAANFVHAAGWFNTHSYAVSTAAITITDATKEAAGNGLGDIINGIAYGAGGGIWAVANFLWNYPFPIFMALDMGMHPLIAIGLQGVWSLLVGLGAVEILTGREILK